MQFCWITRLGWSVLACVVLSSSWLSTTVAQEQTYSAPTEAPAGETQHVRTGQGLLSGRVADGVGWFLGIPYAPPPVGNLRWKPPGNPPRWTGVREAGTAGATCAVSEDCLYLNVLRPAEAEPGQALPVMVWVHGGGFVNGTALGGYGGDTDGREFARQGIIVVSLNYRLGRAGWFAHPALTREGRLHSNYGLMDQVAALRWVRDNIADFGGDPDNVTIFGESAGGASVLYLMNSPEARGLFHKAIAQSSYARYEAVPLAVAEQLATELAEAAGIFGSGPEAAAALRRLPLSDLPIETRGDPGRGAPGLDGRPYPVIDGALIPASIMEVFAQGGQAMVPLIIGGTSNEASRTKPTPERLEQYEPGVRAAIFDAFDPDGTRSLWGIVNDLETVQDMTEPDRAIARLHTAAGAPAWLYYFNYVPTAQRADRPYGAGHTQELPFVFMSPRSTLDAEDLKVAGSMNAYWAAFARNGKPGVAGGAIWPQWTPDDEHELEFAEEVPILHEGFKKAERDLLERLADQ